MASGEPTDTRVEVFLGKGGVGKTTCSAATALAHAESGQPSLVISTDPTPSLSHIFEVEGEHREREVQPGLHLTELGLEEVRAMWDEEFGRDVYGVFSSFVDIDYPDFVQFMTSVLPGLNEEFMVDRWQDLAATCMEFLRRYGLAISRMIVNNVVQAGDSPFLEQKRRQQEQLARIREHHGDVPIVEIPLFPLEVRGVERLRTVGRVLSG